MHKVKGNIILEDPLPNTTHISDLVFYQGPLITLKESGGEKYVWVWVDVNDVCNRWGVFKTTDEKISGRREKEFVFDYINDAVEDGPVYFFNTDLDGNFVAAWDSTLQELLEY
jgi:hypothetical protein